MGFERAGGELDEITLTTAEALDAFAELRGKAADLGVVMAEDVIEVTLIPALAKAIEFTVAQAADEEWPHDAAGSGRAVVTRPVRRRVCTAERGRVAAASRPGVLCVVASAETAEEWEALRWLERAGDPEVWDSGPPVRGWTRSYVVTNQTEQKGGSQVWPGRSNDMRSRAHAVPSTDTFVIVWPQAEPDARLLRRLRGLAARVPYVGRSTSQAEVTVHAESPPETAKRLFRRSKFGATNVMELRVPYPGYTDALCDAFADGRRAWQVARSLPYSEDTGQVETAAESATPIMSPYGDMIVWGLERPTARIDGGRTAHLTAVLRKAVLERVPDPVPPQVCGHGANGRPHVAFLALPDVGHRYADGHLLGLGLAVPRDMPAEDWQRLVQGVAVDPLTRLTVWRTDPLHLAYGSELRGLRPERWTARDADGARVWTTATPMMTDGRLREGRSMAELVRKSLLYAGYPEPVAIETSTAPLIPGAAQRPRVETLPSTRCRGGWAPCDRRGRPPRSPSPSPPRAPACPGQPARPATLPSRRPTADRPPAGPHRRTAGTAPLWCGSRPSLPSAPCSAARPRWLASSSPHETVERTNGSRTLFRGQAPVLTRAASDIGGEIRR